MEDGDRILQTHRHDSGAIGSCRHDSARKSGACEIQTNSGVSSGHLNLGAVPRATWDLFLLWLIDCITPPPFLYGTHLETVKNIIRPRQYTSFLHLLSLTSFSFFSFFFFLSVAYLAVLSTLPHWGSFKVPDDPVCASVHTWRFIFFFFFIALSV